MLGPQTHPDLLAGSAGYEDAGVFRLDAERALVQTVDFFPPIVDDPRWFGRIAAANSLSDVYAMGGQPLTALNLVAWPTELDIQFLGEIMAGGLEKVQEAGAVLCGGHSVTDPVVLYGLSVTGQVHPDRFWRNSGAQEGDVLILTKPLGIGLISSAMKKGLADKEMAAKALEQMACLNKASAEAVLDLDIHAATDITGFGLMGHGCEMAEGSGLSLHLDVEALPLCAGALDFAAQGLLSGGARRGQDNLKDRFQAADGLDPILLGLLFDAETSGGLLLALPESQAEKAQQRLRDAGSLSHQVVGRFARDSGPAVQL